VAPGFGAPQLGWSIPGARREGPRRCRPPRNTRNWRRDLGSPGKTGARTPARLRVDAHHVALERPREGVRYLTCGAFCHRPFGDTLEGRLEHPRIPEHHVDVRHRDGARCPVVRGDEALRCESWTSSHRCENRPVGTGAVRLLLHARRRSSIRAPRSMHRAGL
jgi:hypothetical protein